LSTASAVNAKAPNGLRATSKALNDASRKQLSYGDKVKIMGRRQYSKRLGCIEPVFGNITTNKGMNKLTLRGQLKVNAQWQLYCLVHNIEKLQNTMQ
jgi:hypothetical protein